MHPERSVENPDDDGCLICGSESAGGESPRLRLATAVVRVVSCPNCGFAWRVDVHPHTGTAPFPPQRDSAPYRGLSTSPESGIEEMEEIRLFFDSPGSLLNIGNDSSDIIETARIYGWKSQAVAALEEAEICVEEVPANQWESRPQSCRGAFHVVRLEDALENAPDPDDYLLRIAGYLEGRGLLIVNTVDFSRWDFALFGEGSPVPTEFIPRWFFTPRSLQSLLVKSGFRILKITPYQVPHLAFPQEPADDSRFPQSARWGGAPGQPAENKQFASRFRILAQNAQRSSLREFHAWNYNPQSEFQTPRYELTPT